MYLCVCVMNKFALCAFKSLAIYDCPAALAWAGRASSIRDTFYLIILILCGVLADLF